MPSPAPSPECAAGEALYRLRLYDENGDGWQGAQYVVYHAIDFPAITQAEHVADGTLANGCARVALPCHAVSLRLPRCVSRL